MIKLLTVGFLMFSLTLALSACGKKAGSSDNTNNTNNPNNPNSNIRNTPCVFSTLTDEQIQSIQNELVDRIKQKYSYDLCSRKSIYQMLSANLVFGILKFDSNANIQAAMENNDLVGFITTIYDEQSCQLNLMSLKEINLAKQCQWGK